MGALVSLHTCTTAAVVFSFFCFLALLETAFVRFLQTNEGRCDRNFLPVTSYRPVSVNMIHNGTAPAVIVSILRLKNRSNITLKFTLEHKVKTQQDLFSHVKVIHSSRYLGYIFKELYAYWYKLLGRCLSSGLSQGRFEDADQTANMFQTCDYSHLQLC